VILPAFNESLLSLLKRMYRFYGFINLFRRGIEYSVFKVLDKLRFSSNTVRGLAREQGIELIEPDDINSLGFISELKEKNLDLILSVAASQIFREELLSVPKWGCINIHSAELPKYRGRMPNFWAMYHGDESVGITIHTMDKGIDKGKIILQGKIEIPPDRNLDSLIKKSKSKAVDLVIEVLEKIRSGTVERRDYEGKGSYFSFPTREDVREFEKRGNRLL